jgi:hypothetical protein
LLRFARRPRAVGRSTERQLIGVHLDSKQTPLQHCELSLQIFPGGPHCLQVNGHAESHLYPPQHTAAMQPTLVLQSAPPHLPFSLHFWPAQQSLSRAQFAPAGLHDPQTFP